MKKLSFLIVTLIVASCSAQAPTYNSPPGYDLNHPIVYKMPESLLEISGIAFNHGNKDTLFAEQDEAGEVYKLQLGKGIIGTSVFEDHGDFEDIAICNAKVLMLLSNGNVYGFPMQHTFKKKIKKYKKWKDLVPKGEYEGMYADNKTNKIYILCKKCKVDKHKNTLTGYILNLEEEALKYSSTFQINTKKIAQLIGKDDIHFRPSALTKNSQTDEWYILSSTNKLLVVTNDQWKVEQVYHLNPKIYIQPEGITFDKGNNLYISSEGSDTKAGRVMEIKYKDHE